MNDLSISAEWMFFLGGFLSTMSVVCAKTISWGKSEFLTTEEDCKQKMYLGTQEPYPVFLSQL
jgi:hypothetical protein